MAEPKKRRRRAHYVARIADRICEHIALGDTIEKALKKEPMGPSINAFWKWLNERPDFAAKFELAQQMQSYLQADKVLDMVEEVKSKPKDAPAYRLIADILKWTAEVKNPRRFGQKVQHEIKAPKDPRTIREEILILQEELQAELGVKTITAEPDPAPAEEPTNSPPLLQ